MAVFCAAGLQVKKRWPVFCAVGLQVKKQRVFSAPEGQASKNNEFFLRPRVKRQKIMDFFCAAGLQVKKRWPFSAPQSCKSKKRRLRQHKMLHLNKKTAKKLVHKHFFSTFEALINRRVSNTALTQQAIEKDELRDDPICKVFGSRVHNATTLTGTRPAEGVTLGKITTLNVQKRDA